MAISSRIVDYLFIFEYGWGLILPPSYTQIPRKSRVYFKIWKSGVLRPGGEYYPTARNKSNLFTRENKIIWDSKSETKWI